MGEESIIFRFIEIWVTEKQKANVIQRWVFIQYSVDDLIISQFYTYALL